MVMLEPLTVVGWLLAVAGGTVVVGFAVAVAIVLIRAALNVELKK